MNQLIDPRPGLGDWYRRGGAILLDDPFATDSQQTETGPGAGAPPRPGWPSSAQRDLLKSFFGSDERGARHRMANFSIPPGLEAATLRWYAGIAKRALADPAKATSRAQVVQTLRLRLVARALAADTEPQGEFESFSPDFVRWLQLSLNDVLERNLDVDGRIGAQTRSAIRTFQQLSGLGVDGIPGPLTAAALRAAAVAPCSNVRQPCEILDNFDFDRERVPSAHQLRILHIARCVIASQSTSRPMRSLRVVGHTDSEGGDAYNYELGLRRAKEVARLLTLALNGIRPGIATKVTILSESRGESDPASLDQPGKNRRAVICLPHCTCNGFFREYDLISSPSARFGVPANERLTQAGKDRRGREVDTMVAELLRRRDNRAREALAGRIPAPAPVATGLISIADTLSDAQLVLFRECFPGGTPVIDFAHLTDCFERFANGELRDPAAGGGIEGVGEPEGGFFFLFAEFAFLCVDSKLNEWLWKDVLRIFVMTQEIFMHVYRADQRAPAPPVGAPLPAAGPATRDLDAGFGFRSFNPGAQSDDARKAALRAKYAPMGTDALRAAARDNMLRAQRMP